MRGAKTPDIGARLSEFYSRLQRRPPFTDSDDAYEGMVAILEAVEDELTGIPNDPARWRVDGRLYPPQRDHWFEVPGHPDVTRMRTRAHNVFIAANGALEIQVAGTGAIVLSKAGQDGRKVWRDE